MGDVWTVDGGSWAAINALAAAQQGVVSRAQLREVGIRPDAVDSRVRSGWLRPIQRGVYAIGPIAGRYAGEMAAVLACGEGAVLSHRTAAQLWRLLPHPANKGPVDITVPTGRRIRRPGVRVHRPPALQRGEATKLTGVPITTPARTILDIGVMASSRELEQAVAEALRRHLTNRGALLSLLARHCGRAGTRSLRALLEGPDRPALTRSQAEERLLALLRKAELPAPGVNERLGRYEVDFLWREAGLAVEVDGFAFHGDRAAFEADRRRDAELAARGLNVVRVTWRQIVDEPQATLVRIGQALARSSDRLA
jgi:very-short-patch-repair endonuclease